MIHIFTSFVEIFSRANYRSSPSKDTSTDSGHTSGQSSYSLGGSKKLSGPYNASCVNLVSVGQSGMLRLVTDS